jgi:hypothetical protein
MSVSIPCTVVLLHANLPTKTKFSCEFQTSRSLHNGRWNKRSLCVVRRDAAVPPSTIDGPEVLGDKTKEERKKTYNRRDSQMVTHSSTSRPVQCLCMAERTGCPVFTDLWSYVLVSINRVLITRRLLKSQPGRYTLALKFEYAPTYTLITHYFYILLLSIIDR